MPAHVLLSTRTSFLAFPKYHRLSRSVVTHSVAFECDCGTEPKIGSYLHVEPRKISSANTTSPEINFCVKTAIFGCSLGVVRNFLSANRLLSMFIHLFRCGHHRFLMGDAVPPYSHICCLKFRRLLFIFRSANLHWIVKALVSFGTAFEEGRR